MVRDPDVVGVRSLVTARRLDPRWWRARAASTQGQARRMLLAMV